MKKFQKNLPTQTIKTQCSMNEKPQTDFIALLPKIIKILPQLGINLPFLSPSEPTRTANPPQTMAKPTSLMKEENQKAVLDTMEKHQQAVNKIKSEKE